MCKQVSSNEQFERVLMQRLLILPDRKDEAMPSLKNAIENLTKEQLVELLRMASKNLVAMDGTWFQILEEREGMDYAMEIDIAVWERYPISRGKAPEEVPQSC